MAIITKFLGGVLVIGGSLMATPMSLASDKAAQIPIATSDVFTGHTSSTKPFDVMLDKAWKTEREHNIEDYQQKPTYYYNYAEIKIGDDRFILSQFVNRDCRPDECNWRVIKTDDKYEILKAGDLVLGCGGAGTVAYQNDEFTVCNKSVPLP